MALTTINFLSCSCDSVTAENLITFTISASGPLTSPAGFGDVVLISADDAFHIQCIATPTQNAGTSTDAENWTAKHTFTGTPADQNEGTLDKLHAVVSYLEGVVGQEPKQAEMRFDMREGGNASEGDPNGPVF